MMTRNRLFILDNLAMLPGILLLLFASSSVVANSTSAGLSPTRVVIPDGQQSASFTLENLSKSEVSYRLNLIEMGLDETGQFRTLRDNELHAKQKSVKKYVRFSPRQVRLKPGASQVVRVIAKRRGMDAGEYRSHLLVQSLPVVNTSNLSDSSNSNVRVVESLGSSNVGVTIPIIIRHKTTDASVELHGSSITFDSTGAGGQINLQLGLSGNRSAFGDFKIKQINGKKETIIGELKRFALFYPYPREDVSIRLSKSVKKSDFARDSKIRVVFENRAVDSAKGVWLDVVDTMDMQ